MKKVVLVFRVSLLGKNCHENTSVLLQNSQSAPEGKRVGENWSMR
jgi:hypothetical protein